MGEAAGRDPAAPRFCDACFSGDYPIALTDAAEGAKSGQLSFLAEVA
jgi:amidophosphoribosyltransferase